MNVEDKFFFANEDSAYYDDTIEMTIPGYSLIYNAIIDVIDFHFDGQDKREKGIILDIGAGTGAESILAMSKFQNLHTLAIDLNAPMKTMFEQNYSQKIGNGNERYKYIVADIMAIDVRDERIQSYYASLQQQACKIALSAYCIHHFEMDEKIVIFKKMFDMLEPGGLFINVDIFTYHSQIIKDNAFNFTVDYIINQFTNPSFESSRAIPLEQREALKRKWVNHMKTAHHEDPVETHLRILRDIGFVDVECVFKYWQQAVIRATKPFKSIPMKNEELKYREFLVKIKKFLRKYPDLHVYTPIKNETDKGNGRKKEIADFLEEEQKRLGIIGGCFSILSKADGNHILLSSHEVQSAFFPSPKKEIPEYLYSPYKSIKYDKFIDLSFFASRQTNCPEFIKNISLSEPSPFEYKFQFALRERYEILHCSSGEVLFFTLLWRLLIELIVHNGNNTKFEIKSLNSYVWKKSVDNWTNRFEGDQIENIFLDKLEYAEKNKDNVDYKEICIAHEEFKVALFNESTCILRDIYTELGLNNINHITELNKYIMQVLKDENFELEKNMSEERLSYFSITLIEKFWEKYGIKKYNNLGELLFDLHHQARFPILPYFFLMFFDEKREQKEHIVFPIWYTFSDETKYLYIDEDTDKEEKQEMVLHALYTIKPIWHTENIEEEQCSEDFYVNLNKLDVFFSSFSKLIVDKEYYAEEHKKNKIKEAEQQKFINNAYGMAHIFSNKMGKTGVKGDGNSILVKIKDIEKHLSANEIDRIKDDIKDITHQVEVNLVDLRSLFIMSDVLAKANSPYYPELNGQKIFTLKDEKKEYRYTKAEKEPVDLLKILTKCFIDYTYYCELNNTDNMSDITIEPFLELESGKFFAPLDIFYRELFIEIFNNFLTNKVGDSLDILKGDNEEKPVLLFRNKCSSSNEPYGYKLVDFSSVGALNYLGSLFSILDIGHIYKKIEKTDEDCFFILKLDLKSLNIKIK